MRKTIQRFTFDTMAFILVMVGLFVYTPSSEAKRAHAVVKEYRISKSESASKSKNESASKSKSHAHPEKNVSTTKHTDTKLTGAEAAIAATRNITIGVNEDGVIKTINGSVLFTVNKTNIAPDAPFILELRENIVKRINEQHLELYRIEVRGAASPEGDVAKNEQLAKGRTNVLVDTITSILPTAKSEVFHVTSVAEDYEYLIQLMEEANDPDAKLVKDIYAKWKHSIKDLKWALFTAKQRTLWKRLLTEYFPQLRATRVSLYFRVKADAPKPQKPAVEKPAPEKPAVEKPAPEKPAAPQCDCAGGTECKCAASGKPCECDKFRLTCTCGMIPCQCGANAHPCECGGSGKTEQVGDNHQQESQHHPLLPPTTAKCQCGQGGECQCTKEGGECFCDVDNLSFENQKECTCQGECVCGAHDDCDCNGECRCEEDDEECTCGDEDDFANLRATNVSTNEDGLITTIDGVVPFMVNKTNVDPDALFIRELHTDIQQRIQDQQLELYQIDVRGAASPEGNTANNERLAKARTKVLIDTISNILPVAKDEMFRATSVTEDYEYLIQLMEEANDPEAAIVRDIYNKWKHSMKDLKWALYSAKNRTLWNRLLKEYFPQLRSTRVQLHFRLRPDATAPKPAVKKHKCNCGKDGKPCCCKKKEVKPCVCKPTICRCTSDSTTVCSGLGSNPCACMTDSTTCRCGINDAIGCHCLSPTEPIVRQDSVVVDNIEHSRPVFAIATNLPYDVFYMPDYGFAPMWNGKLEFYPYRDRRSLWNHTSFVIGFINPYWHNWAKHKFFQIRNYEFETRFYHRYDQATQQRYGWYLGAAIDNNVYGIGLDDERGWQGEGLGFQVTGGYVLPLDKCKSWKLEFNLGAGFYETHYDPYIYDDPFAGSDLGHGEYNPPTYNPDTDKLHYYYKWYGAAKDFKKRQYRYRWLGPTTVGISIKYDFLWKSKTRRGLSFRHHEPSTNRATGKEVGHE